MEREEEAYEAKMKGIAEIQASPPIGVTPEILSQYEKKVAELRESALGDKTTIGTLFWNRNHNNPTAQDPPTPQQAMTPGSSRKSEFSFGLDTPQSSRGLNTPLSIASSRNLSYELDTSNDETVQMETPQSRSRGTRSSHTVEFSP